MCGMNAVNHVISCRVIGGRVDCFNGLSQTPSCRQTAVGLQCERDDDGQPEAASGPDDPDGLRYVRDRQSCNEVGIGLAEESNLLAVICLRCGLAHHLAWVVSVP